MPGTEEPRLPQTWRVHPYHHRCHACLALQVADWSMQRCEALCPACKHCCKVVHFGALFLDCCTMKHFCLLQVADGSMQCVSAVSSLKALVLGFTRVQDPGLAMLAALPALTHLALTAEGVTLIGLLVTFPKLQLPPHFSLASFAAGTAMIACSCGHIWPKIVALCCLRLVACLALPLQPHLTSIGCDHYSSLPPCCDHLLPAW